MRAVDEYGNPVYVNDEPRSKPSDLNRLIVLSEQGSLTDVAEAFNITVERARRWSNEAGVNAASNIMRRLLAVQELRRLGFYEDGGPTR